MWSCVLLYDNIMIIYDSEHDTLNDTPNSALGGDTYICTTTLYIICVGGSLRTNQWQHGIHSWTGPGPTGQPGDRKVTKSGPSPEMVWPTSHGVCQCRNRLLLVPHKVIILWSYGHLLDRTWNNTKWHIVINTQSILYVRVRTSDVAKPCNQWFT